MRECILLFNEKISMFSDHKEINLFLIDRYKFIAILSEYYCCEPKIDSIRFDGHDELREKISLIIQILSLI